MFLIYFLIIYNHSQRLITIIKYTIAESHLPAYPITNTIPRALTMVLPLTYLPRGRQARIVWIASTPNRRQRLQDSGIIPDGIISRLLYSPHSHLSICQTSNATLLLLRKTMNEIFVEIPDSADSGESSIG